LINFLIDETNPCLFDCKILLAGGTTVLTINGSLAYFLYVTIGSLILTEIILSGLESLLTWL
jgi:hypothetical protein